MVVYLLLAVDQVLAAGRRVEEPALLLVAEQLDGQQHEPARFLEPAELARRDVELVEAVRDVGVVLEEAVRVRAPVTPRSEKPAVLRRERAEQELPKRPRRIEQVGSVQPPAGLRERRQREPVPGRDHLVVAEPLGPLLAQPEQ